MDSIIGLICFLRGLSKQITTLDSFFDNTALAFEGKSNKTLRHMRRLFLMMNRRFITFLPAGCVRLVMRYILPVKYWVKKNLFRHFCGGTTFEECLPVIEGFFQKGIRSVLDYAVEYEQNEAAYHANQNEVLSLMQQVKNRKEIPFVVIKISALGDTVLMEKQQMISSSENDVPPMNTQEGEALTRVKERINFICHQAYEADIGLLMDAEEVSFQGFIDMITFEMMTKYNAQKVIVYNTFQMYRWDALNRLKEMHKACQKKKVLLGAKLVRGAYMEQERKLAQKQGQESPIHHTKEACDEDFNRALEYCVKHHKKIGTIAATHNTYSSHYFKELIHTHHLPKNNAHFYFSQLYGMGDVISYTLAKEGYNVIKYLPYGQVEKVMSYLYRRMQENKSIRGQSSRESQAIETELQRRKKLLKKKNHVEILDNQ